MRFLAMISFGILLTLSVLLTSLALIGLKLTNRSLVKVTKEEWFHVWKSDERKSAMETF